MTQSIMGRGQRVFKITRLGHNTMVRTQENPLQVIVRRLAESGPASQSLAMRPLLIS
jgi:hypothetical protein